MIRSLTDDFVYPYFCDWDMSIDVKDFHALIYKAHEESFTVVASTCDQSGKNEGLKGKLGITPEKPWCKVKVQNDVELKVFFLNDWVHIFKLTRNQCLDGTIKLPKGNIVTKKLFVQLQKKCNSGEMSTGFFLKDILLNCQNTDRQIVKWALQLLSHTTAQLFRNHFEENAAAFSSK